MLSPEEQNRIDSLQQTLKKLTEDLQALEQESDALYHEVRNMSDAHAAKEILKKITE